LEERSCGLVACGVGHEASHGGRGPPGAESVSVARRGEDPERSGVPQPAGEAAGWPPGCGR
jgi:hypothetical protein